MALEFPVRLADLTRADGEPTSDDVVDHHPHPKNPEIKSPADAMKLLQQEKRSSIQPLAGSARCAWLTTSGNGPYDVFVLNWSGPRASSYDFVAFAYHKGVGVVVDERWWSSGWQWCEKGSPYKTSWTPYSLSQEGGTRPTALYYIWDAGRNMYMGQQPCNNH